MNYTPKMMPIDYKKTNMTDHEFEKFLRSKKAINNYYHLANMVCWYVKDITIACAIYDNANSTRSIYILKEK